MKTVSKTVLAAAILLGLAYGGSELLTRQRHETGQATVKINAEQIRRGEYIAALSDCFACHTAPKGRAYAGGLAMQTPLGAIYSTNITPDKETGIGSYTYNQFKAAVQHGIRSDGTPLYPAMPYASYAVMPDDDIQALYAYFMQGVESVKQKNAGSTIPPVLNWRWPLAYWQAMFAPKRSFEPDGRYNIQLNRGKYLVEGPGHCGACHTPRGIAYQEKALSEDGKYFLNGAVIDGWRAKSLRGDARGLASWHTKEIADFLATGRTERSAAFGAMADVVEHSTRYWLPEDIQAISAYLKTLSPTPGKVTALPAKVDKTTAMLQSGQYVGRGALLYAEHCQVCHRADGNGVERIFPALNKNSAVYAGYPQSVIQITLEGGRMPENGHDVMAFSMPGFKNLSDEDIAEVVNFVRNGWTNQAPETNSKEVAEIRAFVNGKAQNFVPNTASGAHHE
ncbi:c-type cytochrome [Neisseria zalophi]|uniref:Alcohol dehydrogenase n=1 Tax=Neisseria zalophi TaxID=640030 RepID=A0A5J6PWT2_9NEIS|nr:cytochrome c [Neisseria zalophi]QEY25342.1 alcohol dehydrogenase [Neisseria zalophi]